MSRNSFDRQVSKRARRKKLRRSSKNHNPLRIESLEDRRMLALLGITPDSPSIFANSTGSVVYNAASNQFSADATPLDFNIDSIPYPLFIDGPATFDLNFSVNETGNFSGGSTGNDFVVTGQVDIDEDGTYDVSGVLLTGEVIAFGFQDAGSASLTDVYDVRMQVTGGELASEGVLSGGGIRPNYFAGKNIALAIASENSTFNGSFEVNFQGGNKSNFGPTDPIDDPQINPLINIVKYVDKVVTETTTVDFEGLATGEIVSGQIPGFTVTGENARTPGAGNRAMIFDSSNPTGNDRDLGSPNQMHGGPGVGSGGANNTQALGNVLIISEDGDSSDPDDEARGGKFTFTFDQPVSLDYLDVLDIDSNESGGSVVTVTTTSGTNTINIPTAGNNSWQRLDINFDDVTEMTVHFVSSGAISEFEFSTSEKQWFDANDAPGIDFMIDETVEFSYHVTNPGDISLMPVIVVDDNATPGSPADDFFPTPIVVDNGGQFFNVGDANQDDRLDPGEEWIYTAMLTATTVGQFTNIATVTGTPINDQGEVIGNDVTDDDPANYNVIGTPDISIEKWTNGIDADWASEAVEVAPGDAVVWTYWVENTGGTSFEFADVNVVDDNGTPGDSSDDFTPTFDANSDVGADGILSPNEVWKYTFETVAQAVGTAGDTSTFYFDGNSSLDGPNGNIRSFSVDGVTVNASAFSRDSGGTFSNAYLGSYSGGLGVTDSSEGNGGSGRHRLDNIGRSNYIVFEFSEEVIADRAFLDSVVNDSDLSVWFGNIAGAFGNHVSLNDAVLAGLFNEVDDTTSSSSRWANFNDGMRTGNVLVVAASTVDTTPEDQFKVRKLRFQHINPGVYVNVATASAEGVTDSDPSHYRNPAPLPTGSIGNFVWNDSDRDGRQDNDEAGIANVTVNLLNSSGDVVGSTTTDGDGMYRFDGLAAGDYVVEFVAPTDFVFSPKGQGTNADNGSNANLSTGRTDVISLDADESDQTIDAGLYQTTLDLMFEAEDFEWKDSPWHVYNSGSASGGQFIKAPNGSGSHLNSRPYHKAVKYQFNVDQAGSYELSGLVQARNSSDNSLWVKVNNQGWIQWHLDVTGSNWDWQAVTSGSNQHDKSFQLVPGMNTLQIKVREDGTRLDKFMVSKLPTSTVVMDATDFDSKTGAWEVDSHNGRDYMVAANGSGNYLSNPSNSGELRYDFSVNQAGDYQLHGLVKAANGSDNSFWLAVDNGPWIQWHLTVTNGAWTWQTASEGSGQNSVSFDLDAGDHTLKIKVREDGTKLDQIVISNDAGIDPGTLV